MPRFGTKSAASNYSDSSETEREDDGLAEKQMELERLQRQFRVMSDQRDMYILDSQNLIQRQR